MSAVLNLIEAFKRVTRQVETQTLSQRIGRDLKQNFHDRVVDLGSADFSPDMVIRNDKSALIIEIKTGDSSQPLPASAGAQMMTLKEKAQSKIGGQIVPVIVTNYQVDDESRKELVDAGIKIVDINRATYDSEAVSAQIEGLSAHH